MDSNNHIRTLYRFFRDGHPPQEIEVWVNAETLRSKPDIQEPYPEWTRMSNKSCEGCEWAESNHCPIAVRLVKPLAMFREIISHEPVTVEVETDQRFYRKKVDMQQGLSSLFGLLMATSGCPSMAVFRPMAHYHLPFSSFEETFFRISGTYLLRELLAGSQDINRYSVIDGLNDVYKQVGRVNEGVMRMLRSSDSEMADSSPNAVALLAAFSGLVPLTAEKQLRNIERLFK
jgi:hypothetical protein